jgi:hypothetical protein
MWKTRHRRTIAIRTVTEAGIIVSSFTEQNVDVSISEIYRSQICEDYNEVQSLRILTKYVTSDFPKQR